MATKKNNKKGGGKNTAKKNAPSKTKINSFRQSALSNSWKRDDLIEEAESIFGEVGVEQYQNNPKQIAFIVKDVRIPEEGYFSVN